MASTEHMDNREGVFGMTLDNPDAARLGAGGSLLTRRRTPVVLQTETAECGIACLAMIAGHYGRRMDLPALRKHYDVSLKGMTLHDVVHLAHKLNQASFVAFTLSSWRSIGSVRAAALRTGRACVRSTPCSGPWISRCAGFQARSLKRCILPRADSRRRMVVGAWLPARLAR